MVHFKMVHYKTVHYKTVHYKMVHYKMVRDKMVLDIRYKFKEEPQKHCIQTKMYRLYRKMTIYAFMVIFLYNLYIFVRIYLVIFLYNLYIFV